ncbi:MAG: alpha/beta fold hydrolase [Pseudomonadota bacterium]
MSKQCNLKASLVVAGVLLLTACTAAIKNNTASQGVSNFDPVTMDTAIIDAEHPPFIQELFIPSDGLKLSGFLLGANGAGPHPTVLLLHGYPGNEKNLDLAQSMRRAGFNVTFFHYRGAWGSEGSYSLATLSDDVANVLAFLRASDSALRVDSSKLSLIGHSMGGFAALRSAALDEGVVCVAGLAAANLGEYAERNEAQSKGFKAYTDQLIMLNGFSGDQALKEIAANANAFDVRNYGNKLSGKSVLLLAGESDSVVPPAVQQRMVTAYQQQPDLRLTHKVLPGDHSFSSTRILLQRNVINWLGSECK